MTTGGGTTGPGAIVSSGAPGATTGGSPGNGGQGKFRKINSLFDLKATSRDTVLFYHPQYQSLAESIASASENVVLGDMRWASFADGFPNLYVHHASAIRNQHVCFLADFHDPRTIFEQLSVMYAIPRMYVASFTVVLPFFPTGTLERMEDEGDIATASTLARMLSSIPLSRGGPTSCVIYDIHALQERFYFGDNIMPVFMSGVPLLRQRLRELPDASDVVVAYPDEGAHKRFHAFFPDYHAVVCTKVRDGAKRIVRLKEGEPKGKHVVIVDDLVQSGGTLLECARLLSSIGAKRVSAYATHGVFPNESWKRFLPTSSEEASTVPAKRAHDGAASASCNFAYFWITDSVPHVASAVRGVEPFEVLSLAESIANAIQI